MPIVIATRWERERFFLPPFAPGCVERKGPNGPCSRRGTAARPTLINSGVRHAMGVAISAYTGNKQACRTRYGGRGKHVFSVRGSDHCAAGRLAVASLRGQTFNATPRSASGARVKAGDGWHRRPSSCQTPSEKVEELNEPSLPSRQRVPWCGTFSRMRQPIVANLQRTRR